MKKTMWLVRTEFGQTGICDSKETALLLMKDLLIKWEFEDEPDPCDGSPSVFSILEDSFMLSEAENKDEFGVYFEDGKELVWAKEHDLWTVEEFK